MNMTKTEGTPKTLLEVGFRILTTPMCNFSAGDIHPAEGVKAIMRDYLAQKFSVAMMKSHTPEQEAMLEELWLAITGEPMNKGGTK
jgi:hypothetical protein